MDRQPDDPDHHPRDEQLFYTAFKNLIAVVAQVNEAMQQRKWMVTPRTARIAATAAESTVGQP